MGLRVAELLDDILSHIALAGVDDDSVHSIDVDRHKRSSHRTIAKLKCFYFIELPAGYDVHSGIPDDRRQKSDDRGQMTEVR